MNTPFYESAAFSGGRGSYLVGGFQVSGADRQPCPVCGHPTGDCVGSEDKPLIHNSPTFFVEKDVYEEKQLTAGIKTTVIKFKKGTNIPMSEALKHGLVVE